jgi:hypothetical protein
MERQDNNNAYINGFDLERIHGHDDDTFNSFNLVPIIVDGTAVNEDDGVISCHQFGWNANL